MKTEIESNKNLKKYNTFSISASAEKFSIFKSEKELVELITESKKLNLYLFILGGGSNILFTQNVKGIVLKNEISGIQLLEETLDSVLVKCGAGVVWHEFVIHCVNKGYAGLENRWVPAKERKYTSGGVADAPFECFQRWSVKVGPFQQLLLECTRTISFIRKSIICKGFTRHWFPG